MTLAVASATLGLFIAYGSADAATSDPWITTKAKMALLTTEGVSATAINVDTVSGVVTLHGTVASEAEKSKAESVVKGIDGAKQVRNLLQVVAERRQDAVAESDDELKSRVEQALKADGAFSNVTVQSVNAGVVLLSGEVETLSSHLHAIEVASRVPGVRRVSSEIKSPDKLADAEIYSDRPQGTAAKSGGVRDMWITSAVKMRLLADDRTPGLDVNVDTTNGQVALFGMVPSDRAKAAAEEDARKVSGVKSVRNELQVVPASQKEAVKDADERVQARVEEALGGQDELRDANIEVEVVDGVARLTGTVPSQADRIRAAAVARTASGVRAVRDDLRVASK